MNITTEAYGGGPQKEDEAHGDDNEYQQRVLIFALGSNFSFRGTKRMSIPYN